jgi:cell division septal protein FtsQ
MSSQPYYRNYSPPRRSPRRFDNPYFRQRKADQVSISRFKNLLGKISFKGWMYSFLILLILIVIFWLVSFSPFMVISEVKITGSNIERSKMFETEAWRQIDQNRFLFLSQSHLFVFNSKNFRSKINNEYVLDGVKIKKKIPGTLEIIIAEKNPVAVWFETDNYYLIDKEGWIISALTGPQSDLTTVVNNGPSKVNGKRLVDQEQIISSVLESQEAFKGPFLSLQASQFTATHERDTLAISLKEGIVIYFATNEPMSNQFDRLDILLKSDLKDKLSKINYIDLRFGDKVYYK